MAGQTATKTVMQDDRRGGSRKGKRTPALLVAFAPRLDMDRIAVRSPCVVGRGSEAALRIQEPRISQKHFKVTRQGSIHVLEDLGSTNGTYVDGTRAEAGREIELKSASVIRAGECVLVFLADGGAVLDGGLEDVSVDQPTAGRFHLPVLLRQVMEAALSQRPPLLAGPSGVGKEHAAEVLAALWGQDRPRRYNAAAATNPEEMARALFGVASKAFTGVGEQAGLLVTAAKQARPLFLDEVHQLSPEAQATLLTVIEDGKFSRRGAESEEVTVDIRFVFASNDAARLKHDLRARCWRIDIPSLRERVADAPDIFAHLLGRQLERHGIDPTTAPSVLDADLYHDICLEVLRGRAFEESNIRGLGDLADRVAARAAAGVPLHEAIDSVMTERLTIRAHATDDTASHYERHRELISAVYVGCGKNAKKTVDLLREAGLPWTISRRHLTINVEKWGLK